MANTRITEQLTEREREVVALVAAGKTNGEIATTLGVSYWTAKSHVSSILAKLGVESREEAVAAWQAGEFEPVPPVRRRRWAGIGTGLFAGWRAIAIGAAVVVGGGVLAVLFVAALASRENETPAAPDGTATAEPSATAGASPTPFPPDDLPYALTNDAWIRADFPVGSSIPQLDAMYFTSVATGTVERWSLASGAQARYWASPDNRWVVAQGAEGVSAIDRELGTEWRMDDRRYEYLGAFGGTLAFSGLVDTGLKEPEQTGAILFVEPATNEVRVVPAERAMWRAVLFSEKGVAAVLSRSTEHAELSIVGPTDTTRRVIWEEDIPETTGVHFDRGSRPAESAYWHARDWFAIEIDRTQDAGGGTTSVGFAFNDKGPLFQIDGRTGDLSPDRTVMLRAGIMTGVDPCEAEGCTLWPQVEAIDVESGETLFRIRGAQLGGGHGLTGTWWISDGSGFIAGAGGNPATPGSDGVPARRGYAVVARDGSSVSWVPFATDAPVPAPNHPTLVAIGYRGVADLVDGVLFEIDFTGDLADGAGPWGMTSDELRFSSPHGGHGGSALMLLSDIHIEYPPFDDAVRFMVARSETCLNVRAAATTNGIIEGCLPDGTVVALAPAPNPGTGIIQSAVVSNTQERWVRVRAGDGTEGWVSSDYLDWAE